MIRGETLERENVEIDSAQIVLEKPEIEVGLFRDDDKEAFQIQIMMPESSQIHIVESYDKKEEAKQRYQHLLQQLKAGKAQVQIGRKFSIVEQK